MAKIVPLIGRKPKRIGETVFTESGLRLGEKRRVPEAKWFLALLVGAPVLVFLVVFFW